MLNKYLAALLVIILVTIPGFFMYKFFYTNQSDNKVVAALESEVSQQSLSFSGNIPSWLKGTFVRTGPVSVQIGGKTTHWFDGPAMLHAFSFQNGKISYTNKFLRSDVYKTVFIDKSLDYSGFAEEPAHPFWQIIIKKIKGLFVSNPPQKIQNANVNVAEIAHQYVAVTETPLPVRFDITNLDTLGALEFQDALPKNDIFESAHMQHDIKAKEKINYLVEYGKNSKYVVYRYNTETPSREVIGEVFVDKPSYMHSFALTANYIILVEFPFVVNPIDLMLMKKGFINNFHWQPERGTNFLIIDRKTGKLINTINDKKPIFAFHHVNAYEKANNIILDIITYPDATVISDIAHHGDVDEAPNEPANEIINESTNQSINEAKSSTQTINNTDAQTLNQTKLVRYTFSPTGKSISSTVLVDSAIEFPRINERHNAHTYRYIYAVDARPLSQPNDLRPLYKVDTQTLNKILWQEPGLLPGEPIFIPNPEAKKEDDGIILTIVLDHKTQKAFLLMLEGETFKEIGRSYAPNTIPLGLHGQFFELH